MSSAPRILFVTHNVPRFAGDAAGSFVLRLAVALQARGARVHVIAPGAAGLSASDTLEEVTIERVRYAREDRMTLAYTGTMAEAVMGSWSGRLALLQLLFALRRRVRACLDEARRSGAPYDVLHVHWWFPAGLALWRLRRDDDPPMVITMHGSDVRLAEKLALAHPVMRAVLAQAAVRTAVSSWLAETAARLTGQLGVEVAPMPVDTRFFSEAPRTAARNGLLFVGRLNAQKGLSDLLEALARPSLAGVPLQVVGDGPDRAALMQQADALGIAERIRWLGALPQADLAPRYSSARAVIVPSRGEGLGLVAVEAQLCATPVIAYADGGLPDVVRPEHGGALVPPGDIEALSETIASVIASDEEVRRRGDTARRDMLRRFTPEAVADRYLALYPSRS